MPKGRKLGSFLATTSLLALTASLFGCHPTSHAAVPSPLGVARASAALEAIVDVPGPVIVDTVVGADWAVPRSGLLNLDEAKAKEAKLVDGDEPIVVLLHAIRHPTAGLYMVDTGVERAMRERQASGPHRHSVVDRGAARAGEGSIPHAPSSRSHLGDARRSQLGRRVHRPGETSERHFTNLFVRPVVDAALEHKGDVREWTFTRDPDGLFEGVVDIFGNGTVWALQVPGHTDGSTAYLARTPSGPVLLTGDACHTLWGWDHGVEPGSYSSDRPRSRTSLDRLRAFVAKHPATEVRVGHQVRTVAEHGPARGHTAITE